MFVRQDLKCVFFHNPKTGGRSIIKAFQFPEDKRLRLVHFYPEEARRCIFQDAWRDYYSFSFVRNPWDRMVSLYFYQKSVEYGLFQDNNESHLIARKYDFDEWLRYNTRAKNLSNWFGTPQSTWSTGVSEVFRFEDIDEATSSLHARFGQSGKLVKENARSAKFERRPYQEYYTSSELVELVTMIDSDTIHRFNYRFD